MTTPINIVVVGQTPPPFHGQAVMVENLLKADIPGFRLHHVRMSFSRTVSEVGKLSWRKVSHQFHLIIRIIVARLRYRARIMYYFPGGSSRMALYRDILTLLMTRWMFQRLVFHLQAGGVSEHLARQPRWLRSSYLLVCGKPDLVIELFDSGSRDGECLKARKNVVIPNGLKDECLQRVPGQRVENSLPVILFAGALLESKGVMILLEACVRLKQKGIPFRLDIMGDVAGAEFHDRIREYVAANGIAKSVSFLGLRTGDEKIRTYMNSDIFCFPSFYEAEGVPLVVIEAMQFCLPTVATRWRGIPSLVQDGETGYLVPPQDVPALADALVPLLADVDRRRAMGNKARQRYLEEFTIERWRDRIEQAIQGLV